MNIIKVVLVLALISLLLLGFRNRNRVGLRASLRIGVVVVVAVGIASVIQPDIPQEAADLVGVTRGTDLILYLLVVVFALTSAGFYFRFRDVERRMVDIVRAAAIQQAVATQGLPSAERRSATTGPVPPADDITG